jgi:small nuclear ribonucleoprotein (snRNP)-like protein
MEGIDEMTSWMNKKCKVKTTDQREYIGILICIDHFANILLHETKQYMNQDIKYLGLVMVPGKEIIQVCVE